MLPGANIDSAYYFVTKSDLRKRSNIRVQGPDVLVQSYGYPEILIPDVSAQIDGISPALIFKADLLERLNVMCSKGAEEFVVHIYEVLMPEVAELVAREGVMPFRMATELEEGWRSGHFFPVPQKEHFKWSDVGLPDDLPSTRQQYSRFHQ